MERVPVTLLDYGVGNLHSLRKAFENAGAEIRVESDAARILESRCLALPGVGAFGKVAERLAPIRDALKTRFLEGLPALAVCIGMQILYESSEEGEGRGIGLLEGGVRRLRHRTLPHMGWNTVAHDGSGLFAGIPTGAHFYFVHSFAPSSCGGDCVATADYGGPFAAAAAAKNVWAVQFHPEKSSDPGRRVIENFLSFARGRT